MRFGIKITGVFILGLLIVGAVGLQSYLAVQRLTATNRWVTHSHEVRANLEHILSVLKDAETGQRGYLLTGEDRYLEPYNAAAAEILKDIDTVAAQTKDNAQQQTDLDLLRKLSRDKLDELQATITLRKEGGAEAALAVVRSDRGQRIMDTIRGLVVRMDAREKTLLDTRSQAAAELTRQSLWSVTIGVLMSLSVLGVAAIIVIRTMRRADHRPPIGGGKNRLGIAVRYGFAVAVVAVATAARAWLEQHVGPMPLFVTWYPAVLLVASIGGGGPGVVATLLAALAADYWFIAPAGFGIANANDAVATGIFVGTGLFLSVLAERLHRSRWAEAVSATQEQELALLNMGNVMALDLDHHILRWSEGNHRLYGFDAQEARGKLTYEFLQTQFDRPLEPIHAELKEKGYWEGEVTRRTKGGAQLSVALLWALRRDAKGKPLAILEVSTDITRQKSAEEAFRQLSEELAQQNEELTQQSEELSQQNEELQTQSEEIQGLNTELGHRERTLQTLLDASRLPLGEQEVLGTICRSAMEMVGQPATGVVVCERQDDRLQILACAGFDGSDVPASWPAEGSFVEVVMQQNRTACLDDTSLRPELHMLPVDGRPRFAAVLASPVRVKGTCVGAVSIYSNHPQPWTAEHFRLVEWLAAQCSNTLEAMRLAADILESQKQNEFLAGIVEASSQPFGVGYPDGHLGLINKAFEQLTGYTGAELRAIDWARTLTPPEWMAIERQKLEELHRTSLPVRYEKEYIRKDGTRVPIELLVHLVKDAAGKPLYYYSFLTDITERKAAQEALRRGEERLRFALETIHTGAWDLDLVDHTAFRSLEHDRVFGYAELLPQWTYEMFVDHVLSEDRAMVDSKFRRAMENRNDWNFECRIRRADGQVRWILGAGRVQPDASGAPRRMAGIVQDITDRKQAENALREAAEELARSNRDLEQFAYVTSHDLKEPLRMVTGFTSLLKERYQGKLDENADQYLTFAADAATRMQGLVDDLLAYARVGRDRTKATVDINQAVDQALENLQTSIEESGARITRDPLPTVQANPLDLGQLFQNLIGNAVKFRKPGVAPQVHVGARRVPAAKVSGFSVQVSGETGAARLPAPGSAGAARLPAPAGVEETGTGSRSAPALPETRNLTPETSVWLFSVRDNGIGIEPQYGDKIFEIFQRLHVREEYPGSGVGLAICKKIVEQQGGRIWVESEAGTGSTFYFTLPG